MSAQGFLPNSEVSMNTVIAINTLHRMRRRLLSGQSIGPESIYIRSLSSGQATMSKEIVELRSTVAAQHDLLTESGDALTRAQKRIAELEVTLKFARAFIAKQYAHIADLEALLSAAFATIEGGADEQIAQHNESIVCPQCKHVEQATGQPWERDRALAWLNSAEGRAIAELFGCPWAEKRGPVTPADLPARVHRTYFRGG